MKKYKHILLIAVVFSMQHRIQGQVQVDDLANIKKYWFYRYRL